MSKKRRMVAIIFILLSSIKISTTHASDFSKKCVPSRCGDQDIRYPFRLKGDPNNCGDERYQLSCIGNRTLIMGAPYDKYLVTNINYKDSTMEVVDSDLASGKCNLPFQALTFSYIPNGYTLSSNEMSSDESWFAYERWFAFVNCSKSLPHDNGNGLIPCLSHNKRFIYIVYGYQMMDLPASCSYLTMVPVVVSDVDLSNIGNDVFGILKQGFSISWGKPSRLTVIRNCLIWDLSLYKQEKWMMTKPRGFIFLILIPESAFLGCISNSDDFALFWCSLAFLVFLHIVSFYLVIITLGRLVIAPVCIHLFLLYELLKKLSPIDHVETFLRNQQQTTLTRYVYMDIVAMTSHFKDRLGQGGFGTVYKGELPGGYFVAVKLLGKSNDNGEDFISEVSTIGTIHHTNVVRLIGFCSEGLHRALVYEYMYNGSLDKYIFSSTRKFTTTKLNEIAIGVARGIDYLHRGCNMRILHFDIKPHNILLDGNFNPKVSDFGLAKLYSKDTSLVSTFAVRGTIGYMAPELISRSFGLISYKSDVYSFGMLLLEMASGRRNYDSRVENSSEAYYPSWIYDRLNNQTKLEVLDHIVEPVDIEMKLCKAGLWCIQMSPSSRPTMLRVLEMLEGDVEDVEMPPKPFFFCSSNHTTRGQNSFQMCSNEISTIYESE